MHALGLDLEDAVQRTVQEIASLAKEFDRISSRSQATVSENHSPGVADELGQLIQAYQAIVTGVLHFSIESPRYGLFKDRRSDSSFVVDL